eukprot:gnl/TRDRNA2_/TRDRNA2_34672_c1_seq1.p1 gnl/TRDRNA2_/TRDRNA2_34672_c1~~gnl/TRDRNA2_/TRDRNA2_34672_c1_seq1.p1  ORF type:complete len:164 (+),score=18.32 gnl/TRDRNA2_/TRDRNA2_34672_c1_seq1:44-493(+)
MAQILPITVSLLKVLKSVLLTMQFEDIVRFFKTMRAGEAECDTAAIGQMVVAQSLSIIIPPHIEEQLQAAVDDDMPFEDDEAPYGEPHGASSDPSSSTIGSYWKSFGDLAWDPLGWWGDSRDNRQPRFVQSRTSSNRSAQSAPSSGLSG